jgi:pimeloyl-ACP methyl ester carboxylesterase
MSIEMRTIGFVRTDTEELPRHWSVSEVEGTLVIDEEYSEGLRDIEAGASVTYNKSGVHPGLMEGLENMRSEDMAGSPWHEEYAQIAPNPEDFATLFAKKTQMDREIQDLPAEAIEAIKAPTLLIIGDSDIVRPEHAVEMFRLLGGGVMGDLAGLPNSQLAVLPGTTHVSLVERSDWLLSMIGEFLDAPMAEG